MMIQATHIEKNFGTLKVLKDVHLQVDKGEVVAIMGASGAGKSTLLQILGTLMRPDQGELSINGVSPIGMSERQLSAFRNEQIGFVFQAHHLLPEFSAEENVMIPALIARRSQREARNEARELLARVGLSERLQHAPSELSGGEQQRVAIARSLINSPAIVFADEPTGNLDSNTKAEIHQLIFRLRKELGQTFVIVTHDPELSALCDRTLILKDGQIDG